MDNRNIIYTDTNLNNDLLFEHSKLVSSIGIFITGDKIYNNNIKSYVDKTQMVRMNELYYTQYLTKNLSISVGIFPFKKGTFYEYGYNGNRIGVGLYSHTDSNLQGGIVTYKTDKHTFQLGSVAYEKYFKSYKDYAEGDGDISFSSYQDSGMNYISYKYNRDKWYSEIMLTNIYQYVNKVKIIDTNTASLAVSYDNEIDTGTTYYSILTYSNSIGDTISMSPTGNNYITDYYHFGKFETSGYSWLLGIKQELDSLVFNKDIVLGFEYLRISPGYHSLLAGEPFSSNSYSKIGDNYSSFIGVRFDKNTILKFRHYKYENNGLMTKSILTTVSTNADESSGSYDAFSIQLYIDF